MTRQMLVRLVLAIVVIAVAPSAGAQRSESQLKQLQSFVASINRLPEAQRLQLPSATKNLYRFAQVEIERAQSKAPINRGHSRRIRGGFGWASEEDSLREFDHGRDRDLASVNDRSLDFALSASGGFTQDESSTAWCGNNVVVGYEDSGAYLRTGITHPEGATSYLNVASSTNEGRNFKAQEYMNPGTDPLGVLSGNPTVACGSAENFYYAAAYSVYQYNVPNPEQISAIALFKSSDGGSSWGPLTFAIKSIPVQGVSSPWLAVDPSHPANLYLAYIEFDISDTNKCNADYTISVNVIASHDSGSTWSSPTIVDYACNTSHATPEAPRIAIDRTGKVYLSYTVVTEFGAFGTSPDPTIYITNSTDNGATFASSTAVPTVHTGDYTYLEGQFQTNGFSSLAIDPVSSVVYLVWPDGRLNPVPDPAALGAAYDYADILLIRSEDGGATWTQPTAVSPTPGWYGGAGRDQFQPSVAVDHAGTIAVCYDDRRRDPENLAVDRYCSKSSDHGITWSDHRLTEFPWTPAHNFDFLGSSYLTIGDYDTTASDFTGAHRGFVGAFQVQRHGNADIFAARF